MVKLLVCSISVLLLTGCASLVAPPYSSDYATLDKVKKERGLKAVSLSDFQPIDPNAVVNKIGLRGSSLRAKEGTFSKYIENAMRSDLLEMGIYDASSNTKIFVDLLKNDIDVSGFSKGAGLIEIKLSVKQSENVMFEKNYSANTTFESSFAGAVAIPKGQNEYSNLVKALLQQIYLDRSFLEALKK